MEREGLLNPLVYSRGALEKNFNQGKHSIHVYLNHAFETVA